MITVVTPHVPVRSELLAVAMTSVADQTQPAAAHLVVVDHAARGESATRNLGLSAVDTPWVAFLDDDDVLYPNHLDVLLKAAGRLDADVAYSNFETAEGAGDGITGPFDASRLARGNYIPVTTLVRTDLAREVGGFPDPGEDARIEVPTDWCFLLRLVEARARFAYADVVTWRYRRWDGALSDGTRGRPFTRTWR